jgi:heme A synthase
MDNQAQLPTAAIVTMLALACLLSLVMLNARIRAREVVRG